MDDYPCEEGYIKFEDLLRSGLYCHTIWGHCQAQETWLKDSQSRDCCQIDQMYDFFLFNQPILIISWGKLHTAQGFDAIWSELRQWWLSDCRSNQNVRRESVRRYYYKAIKMQSKSARLLTTGRVPQWAQVTIFRRKNGRQRFNGCNSETKGDIVMDPTENGCRA